MILRPWNAEAFKEYSRPLEKLENDLRKAGLPIIFRLFVTRRQSKMVMAEKFYMNQRFMYLICIEGKSPAQAAEAVKKAVSL